MENIPKTNGTKELTEEEIMFCELYVNGGITFAGQHGKCYCEAFSIPKDKSSKISLKSKRLLSKPVIAEHIQKIFDEQPNEDEAIAIKLQVTETLRSIMSESSTEVYTGKYGERLSPAPLRAVAVNAARVLTDMYPIKHATESKLKIEGGEGGITFNVVVPAPPQNKEE